MTFNFAHCLLPLRLYFHVDLYVQTEKKRLLTIFTEKLQSPTVSCSNTISLGNLSDINDISDYKCNLYIYILHKSSLTFFGNVSN